MSDYDYESEPDQLEIDNYISDCYDYSDNDEKNEDNTIYDLDDEVFQPAKTIPNTKKPTTVTIKPTVKPTVKLTIKPTVKKEETRPVNITEPPKPKLTITKKSAAFSELGKGDPGGIVDSKKEPQNIAKIAGKSANREKPAKLAVDEEIFIGKHTKITTVEHPRNETLVVDVDDENDSNTVDTDTDRKSADEHIENSSDGEIVNQLEKKKTKKEEHSEKLEECFEPNPENIDFFTKGLDATKLLNKKSSIENDTIAMCLLFKSGKLTAKTYKCCKRVCKVRKLWNDKPIQLVLNRINAIANDMRPENLELLCPNCYMQTYGLELFKKQLLKSSFVCKYCKFPLVNFSNGRKKNGVCLSCETKMLKASCDQDDAEYNKQLKQLYSENPVLGEDMKKSKYYNEVSRYKKFDDKRNGKTNDLSSIKPVQKSIFIDCNTDLSDITNLEDLLDVQEK